MSFDGLEYIASYADLSAAFGPNEDAGAAHYIQAGQREGRVVTFDGLEYIASYADLRTAFGANGDAGSIHFITNGRAEGRVTTFDGLEYIASYADLANAFGANSDAGSAHYITEAPARAAIRTASAPITTCTTTPTWRPRSATMSRPPPPTTSPTVASRAAPMRRSTRWAGGLQDHAARRFDHQRLHRRPRPRWLSRAAFRPVRRALARTIDFVGQFSDGSICRTRHHQGVSGRTATELDGTGRAALPTHVPARSRAADDRHERCPASRRTRRRPCRWRS